MIVALSIVCGLFVGFALGLVGGGGSTLATPLLLYVVGVGSPHVAIGTGAAAVSVAALTNLATHARAGHVRWRNAAMFAAVGILGALAGSTLGKAFDGQRLLFLFGCLMVAVALMMLRSSDEARPRYESRSDAKVSGLALFAGMASGFFGIGGGFLIVPCLLFATTMPMIEAVGSSLLAVAAFSITTAANYARSGLVDWRVAGLFVLGGVVGGFAGMKLAVKLCESKDRLRKVFAIVVLAIAAYVIWRSFGALLAGR